MRSRGSGARSYHGAAVAGWRGHGSSGPIVGDAGRAVLGACSGRAAERTHGPDERGWWRPNLLAPPEDLGGAKSPCRPSGPDGQSQKGRERRSFYPSIPQSVRPKTTCPARPPVHPVSFSPAGASSARWCIQRPLVHPVSFSRIHQSFSSRKIWSIENLWYLTVPPGKNPVKNTGFCPRQTAPKRHSTLFLQTILCRIAHVPHHRSGPAPILAWPCRPAPTQPDPAPAVEFFSRSQLLRQN